MDDNRTNEELLAAAEACMVLSAAFFNSGDMDGFWSALVVAQRLTDQAANLP